MKSLINGRAIVSSLVALILCITAGTTTAQPQKGNLAFPAGLKWEQMAITSFNFRVKTYGTIEQRRLAESIWQKRIDATPPSIAHKGEGRMPSFILTSVHEDKELRYVFSSFSAAESGCEQAPNGPFVNQGSAPPMYSKCPMRVIVEEKSSGRRKLKDFADYCHLFVDDSDAPASENHTEFAFDDRTGSAYFRVIQYGKHAPECDRALHLK